MIVAKAVNMAKKMDIPIVGVVENMSYLECPDCGKRISVFGESHIEDVAKEYGIPVLAHLGLLPQHIMTAGGYKLTGKTPEDAARLLEDARKVEAAGAFATVLECMPSEVGKMISENISIPTIGIGSGPDCDGQVQVLNDLLGLFEEFTPKHARRYAELGRLFREAVTAYAEDVRTAKFR